VHCSSDGSVTSLSLVGEELFLSVVIYRAFFLFCLQTLITENLQPTKKISEDLNFFIYF
jgi:hypothetical protein